MAYPTEPSVYTGTAGVAKNTALLTHTAESYKPVLRMAAFSSTPALKLLALKAWGAKAALGDIAFGNVTKTSGKGVTFSDGGFQFSGPIFNTTATGSNVGRLANINPQFLEPGNGFAYSWVRYVMPLGIPEEFVDDNTGSERLLNRLTTDLKIGQQSMIRDLNYMFLGHASAPSGSPTGLKDLVAVTQTATIGGIATTNSFWQNCYTPITSVGGGGELDRPLALIRKMQGFLLRLRSFAESSTDQVILGTTGAFQYYLRAVYADDRANVGLRKDDISEANIDHAVFNGIPVAYDGSVTVPTGATASTECLYFLDFNELGINIKSKEYFKLEPWEAPRAHDKQRYYQSNMWMRWTPYVTARRIQGVLYNMTANSDTITSNG